MAPKARRYAQAIFEIAAERDSFDEWAIDLDAIADALTDPDFVALLDGPQVPAAVKSNGIDTVLGSVGELGRNLVRLLVSHRQPRLGPAIRDEYREMLDARRGIVRADITTAVPLDDAQRTEVLDRLSGLMDRQVDATWREDEAVLGGIVARVGDRLIDGSVRSKLEALRRTLGRPVAVTASGPGAGEGDVTSQ